MPNTIYLTRHGQSEYNLYNKIGGDSNITTAGKKYAIELFEYIRANEDIEQIKIFTSELKRTQQTAKHFPNTNKSIYGFLNEIDAGDFDNLTYDEIKIKHSEEYKKRKNDKFNYQYPSGESYFDLKNRVKEIMDIINKEDENNVLIVCHNAVLRVIYSLFFNIDDNEVPHLDIPLHTLFKLTKVNNKYELEKLNLSKIQAC